MLEGVAFICGASVMVLEMAGARVLAPYLGTSIVVWTALIGVILASLSFGYWTGGRLGDRNPSAATLAKMIAGGSGFVLVAAPLHSPILDLITGWKWPIEVSAVAAAVVLFSVPSILLGMVSPYIIQVRLLTSTGPERRTGTVMGRFFALSTIGSIVGTFLGGYWLISWFGTRVILYVVAATLAIAAVMAAPKMGRKNPGIFLFSACLCMAVLSALTAEKDLAVGIEQDTRYNHIKLQEGESADGQMLRCLFTDPGGMAQSCMFVDDPDALVFNYTRHYAIAWHMVPEAKTFLMLGGGGYSVPRYLVSTRPAAVVDVVEIDPGITAAAETFLALKPDPRIRIFHEDARVFLNQKARMEPKEPYDIIMGDTFTSSYNIPFHLGTVECAEKIRMLLKDDGVFICNIISAVTGDKSRVLQSIHGALDQVFPQTHIFPIYPDRLGEIQNVMVMALKSPRPIPGATDSELAAMLKKEIRLLLPHKTPPLVDDFAPVERYALPMLGKNRA
ncbi:fused MFS/spermidine synthase [Desulfosarcina sp. OttesenSCG-928-A07]|nr:fused MFS/spermidine synthase [Desulfosarcina sp. OttesenSCG-928-G17]MDL2329886.1 fused MFS/spermidine synthase [Desulfosarcina sp. OttesenSCG-928-A07]